MDASATADSSSQPTPAVPPPVPVPPPAWPRLWANAFLLLNLLSGTFTVLHAAFGNANGILWIASCGLIFHFVALLAVVTAISFYRGTPWGHLSLPLLAAIWSGHALMPLPAIMSLHKVEYASGVLEIAVTAFCLLILRLRAIPEGAKASFLFTSNDFKQFRFSPWKSIAATVLHLIILPVIYLLSMAYGLVWMINTASGGFIRVDQTGVQFQARSYRLNDKQIHLLPTVHIANPSFYKRITSAIPELPPETTIVIPEGVTDRTGILKNPLDYSGIAEAAGLTAQPRSLPQKIGPRSVQVDADISEFAPEVKTALNRFTQGMAYVIARDFKRAAEELSAMDSKAQELFWLDILENRNQRVLSGIDIATGQREGFTIDGPIEHIIVPWGAAHMPGLERGLLERKARLEKRYDIELIRWSKIAEKFRQLLPPE